MNAENLDFENESIDCIFSFFSFEHFYNPQRVLEEAIRVIKKNGYIYLSFAPLYMAPWGLHGFESIYIPYSTFLFPIKLIRILAKKINRPLIDPHLNKWSLEQYRGLWNKFSDRLKIVRYKEYYNLNHLDLIKKYPSCFKSKTNFFENLIVSKIDVLFKKIN